jgi:hypothetical protein
MVKLAFGGLVAVVMVLFSVGQVRQGARDTWRSLTRLEYPVKRDMRHSVVINPQKTVNRVPDERSVPVTGREYILDREVLAATLVNPTPAADRDSAIARGERKYRVTCSPCHGLGLLGDGTVAALFMPPPDLLAQPTRERADGYLYAYIRHGGIVMPSYGAAVTEREAWDLIEYIRHLQQVSPR